MPTKSSVVLPPGTIDCHVHLFGPPDRFPYDEHGDYAPPLFRPKDAADLFESLGVQRAVYVQPSIYGTDNSAQLEGALEVGVPFRAVVVVSSQITPEELQSYHRQGARGLRFTLAHPGSLPIDELESWASRVSEFGWHIEFLVRGEQLIDLEQRIARLPCPAVIDHMGMFPVSEGVKHPACKALLRLMDRGVWTKLSGPYRLVADAFPYDPVKPAVREIVSARPDRVVWGSDWPHVFAKTAPGDTSDLVDLLADWVPDQETLENILVKNPETLYGF